MITLLATALSLVAPAHAQAAPEPQFTAIFHHDRSGAVTAMEVCRDADCRRVDLAAWRVEPTRGGGFLVTNAEDATEGESWDPCRYNYEDQVSECDAWEPEPSCECSMPSTWTSSGAQ